MARSGREDRMAITREGTGFAWFCAALMRRRCRCVTSSRPSRCSSSSAERSVLRLTCKRAHSSRSPGRWPSQCPACMDSRRLCAVRSTSETRCGGLGREGEGRFIWCWQQTRIIALFPLV